MRRGDVVLMAIIGALVAFFAGCLGELRGRPAGYVSGYTACRDSMVAADGVPALMDSCVIEFVFDNCAVGTACEYRAHRRKP